MITVYTIPDQFPANILYITHGIHVYCKEAGNNWYFEVIRIRIEPEDLLMLSLNNNTVANKSLKGLLTQLDIEYTKTRNNPRVYYRVFTDYIKKPTYE